MGSCGNINFVDVIKIFPSRPCDGSASANSYYKLRTRMDYFKRLGE